MIDISSYIKKKLEITLEGKQVRLVHNFRAIENNTIEAVSSVLYVSVATVTSSQARDKFVITGYYGLYHPSGVDETVEIDLLLTALPGREDSISIIPVAIGQQKSAGYLTISPYETDIEAIGVTPQPYPIKSVEVNGDKIDGPSN